MVKTNVEAFSFVGENQGRVANDAQKPNNTTDGDHSNWSWNYNGKTIFWDFSRLFETFWDFGWLFETFYDFLRLLVTFWHFLRLLITFWDFFRLLNDFLRLLVTFWNVGTFWANMKTPSSIKTIIKWNRIEHYLLDLDESRES